MSGTIPLSMTQQFDSLGKPLAGGLLYTIQAGTTSTPQNSYQDSALTIALPNPIKLDAAGRIPQMFLADGLIKVRLTDKNGVTQIVADGIQVIGPSSGGGGGGGGGDATTILATGDIKVRYGIGSLSGFVRMNGRTIGSSTSGATERANADTQALFEYLWGADTNLPISGGRGASANADWVANKTIGLPDVRSRGLMALSDMGNTTDGSFNGLNFARGNSTTLGSVAGAVRSALSSSDQLPLITPAGTVTIGAQGLAIPGVNQSAYNVSSGSPGTQLFGPNGGGSGIQALFPATSASLNITPFGSSTPTSFATISPFMLVTYYIKM